MADLSPPPPAVVDASPASNGDLEPRRTNIQVCVRLRPILPSDARRPTAKSGLLRRNARDTPTKVRSRQRADGVRESSGIGSGIGGGLPRSPVRPSTASSVGGTIGAAAAEKQEKDRPSTASHHFARTTESSQRRVDDDSNNDGGGGGATAASAGSALIPAWEVDESSADGNSTNANSTQTIYQNPLTHPDPARKTSYSFDRVFGPTHSTSSLYSTSISDVVNASMEGYHGSVFAYGQTSTGKTHTMTGTPQDPGIVPLAVRDCFRYIRNDAMGVDGKDREFLLRVSYMEIYNEQICDLLAPPPVSGPRGSMRGTVDGSTNTTSSNIRIFESKTEGVVIRGLKEEVVTSPEQVLQLLAQGEARRRTGATSLNRASSRSHSIFRLIIESRARGMGGNRGGGSSGTFTPPRSRRNSAAGGDDDSSVKSAMSSSTGGAGGPVRVSSLNLVDLAGSESVKASGATGTRQKEGQYINKSLMTLGLVIYKLSELSAKAEKEARNGGLSSSSMSVSTNHIPYRDSKLTRLLQPSLSGNAQICIVCNISPLTRNLEESHNTLKFATRAKRIKQNASINEVVDDRTLLQNYREEIEALKTQLREAKEAQEALQKEKEAATPTQLPLDENEEDIRTLVDAIQNLEKLILRKTSIPGSAAKEPQPKSQKGKELGRTGSFFASENFDSLLADDEQDSTDEADAPSTRRDLSKELFSHVGDNANVDENRDGKVSEEDVLITELHRIQGLLGSALKRGRGVLTPPRPSSVNANGSGGSVQNTPSRDEEVELLRSQLKEQEVATSLRKADSSFLQSQLQEKDNLLKEVSKILDAVERRQVELEEENARMRQALSQKTLLVESQSKEIERLSALGQNLPVDEDQDDDLFEDLVD